MRNFKQNVELTTSTTSTVSSMDSNSSLSSALAVYITPSVSFIINLEARTKKIFQYVRVHRTKDKKITYL